jgi:hypothetical protein
MRPGTITGILQVRSKIVCLPLKIWNNLSKILKRKQLSFSKKFSLKELFQPEIRNRVKKLMRKIPFLVKW